MLNFRPDMAFLRDMRNSSRTYPADPNRYVSATKARLANSSCVPQNFCESKCTIGFWAH